MKYSIIMPTYNSIRWIKSSVSSVLAQTYTGFEIIIVDGGSRDGTIEWVRSLDDERIKIFESSDNLDIVQNWSRFTTIPKGKYMTIMGHDDILYPNYLDSIDKLIDRYPDAGLYQTQFGFIDEKGQFIRECKRMKANYRAEELLESILQHSIEITATGYMMRSEKYDAIGGIPPYPNLLYADIELWIRLIEDSYLAVSGIACFDFRFHTANTSKSAGDKRIVSFEKMIAFFRKLSDNSLYNVIIKKNGFSFLKSYAIGSCHKLLYVPKINRNGMTMEKIVESAKRCAEIILPGIDFRPETFREIRFAKLIDSNTVLRKLFLFFKSLKKRTY